MTDKLIRDLLLHVRAMWKFRWLGLYTAAAIALVSALVIMAIPKKFEASARIYANTDSILKPLMEGMTVQPDINQRVAMLSRVVISRPNVEHLIKVTGLDEDIKSEVEREQLIDHVMKVLELQRSGGRSDNIYVVKFRDSKPERARQVVELLVSMFIDTSKGGSNTDTSAAQGFLDEQVAQYEKKLRDAENRLKDFKMRNIDHATSADGKDHLTQLAEIGEQLTQAQMQLREAQNSRDAFRRGLASELAMAGASGRAGAGSGNLVEIDARLDAMRRNLESLLQKYTDNHPDVLEARRVVRDLEAQRQKITRQYADAGVPLEQALGGGGARASEQIKVSLAQAEASVASLQARVAEYAQRSKELKELVSRMPQYEAELAQLNRDYKVNKENYESLVARRERAKISGEMQAVSGVADFRLVDPPRVAPGAVFPNRPILLVLSFLAAIAAGVMAMFAAKQMRPSIYDRQQLREVTGLPILGAVSMVVSEQMKAERKADLRRFLKMAGALLAAYVSVVGAMLLLTRLTA